MEKLEKLYPTFLEDDKKEAKKIMASNQARIIVIINIIVAILSPFYFAKYIPNSFTFIILFLVLLLLLTVMLIIFERKILPIGQVSKNKIRKICKNLHHSPKYILRIAGSHEKWAEKGNNQLKNLRDYLKTIETPETQKMLIEKEKERIIQIIEQTKKEIDSNNDEARYYKKFASYLQEVLTK